MNSIFVRIYGGMLASMFLVGLVSYFIISQSNSQLNTAYHEYFLKGTFRVIAQGIGRTEGVERSNWFDLARESLQLDIKLKSLSSSGWGHSFIEKLKESKVIVDRDITDDHLSVFAVVPSNRELVVYANARNFTEQHIFGTIQLVIAELVSKPPVDWESILADLEEEFGFSIERRDLGELDINPKHIEDLLEGKPILQFTNNASNISTIKVTMQIPNEEDYLVMGPVSLFDFLPFHLFFVWGVVAIFIMALVSYLLVKPLMLRLKRLEETAVKIRRDDLSARVTVDSHDALGRLASTFNDMAEHIQRLISSQREMTNAVSHELRTPVARIRFGLEMLGDTDDAALRDNQIEGIDKDIQELETLIDEILTYASLEEGTPSLDFQLIEIDSILAQVKSEADKLGKEVTVEHKPSHEKGDFRFAECEERYIHRVVQNLVGNAMRYAKNKVRISCACEGGMYRVDVEDDGPGIPPEKWEKVFIPFARLDDSRTRASGGYGLGLSIVQRIAYWHGGLASVNQSQLGGARFTIIWPRRQVIKSSEEERDGA